MNLNKFGAGVQAKILGFDRGAGTAGASGEFNGKGTVVEVETGFVVTGVCVLLCPADVVSPPRFH